MQREDILEQTLYLLEYEGIARISLDTIAKKTHHSVAVIRQFWPDEEAMLYDALRYLSSKVETWQRQLMLDETLSIQQKLLQRYQAISECLSKQRYPGCLFIAACTFYPDPTHPIHQLADQQKKMAWHYTHCLLSQLEIDDPVMVADQMELVLEGCLSKLLVKHQQDDIDTARRLAEDVLRFALCRSGGALT